jgi:hypothetical protein
MKTLSLFSICGIVFGILRTFSFFYHFVANENPESHDLFCGMGMLSYAGEFTFYVTILFWPATNWYLCHVLPWVLNECVLVGCIILLLVTMIENKTCCTNQCFALLLTDFASLNIFAALLLLYGLPFLRPRILNQIPVERVFEI